MIPLTIPFSLVGLLAVMYILHIFATLSRRLGAVTKMKPYYRGFYAAILLVALAAIVSLLPRPVSESQNNLYLLAYHLPLMLGGLISLGVAYRYWGWLFRERIK